MHFIDLIVTFGNRGKVIQYITRNQYVTKPKPSYMAITNADNQAISLKNKIEIFFKRSIKNKRKKGFCITRDIMAVVMDKWSLFVIYNLAYFETLRFGQLKSNIRGISSRMLTVTLKKLENHNIISRRAYAEVPPRVEYNLTDFGKELADKSVDLNEWFLNNYVEN